MNIQSDYVISSYLFQFISFILFHVIKDSDKTKKFAPFFNCEKRATHWTLLLSLVNNTYMLHIVLLVFIIVRKSWKSDFTYCLIDLKLLQK